MMLYWGVLSLPSYGVDDFGHRKDEAYGYNASASTMQYVHDIFKICWIMYIYWFAGSA